MTNDRAGRFDRADFEAKPRKPAETTTAERILPVAQVAAAAEQATPALPRALPPPPPASVAAPAMPPAASATLAGPAWRRSELRPDDQIVNIVDTGPAPASPLVDDARTSFVIRDGDSNRVILVDTGPILAQRIAQGTAVTLVQGSPVALTQGAAVPMTAGQSVPLSQGKAVPAAQETSPLSIIKEVLGNPALQKAAASALSAERSGDVAQQEQGENNFLSTALGSVLSNFNSS